MKQTWIVVDVEADGPCPGLYSMVSLGAVRLDRDLKTTFYGRCAPLLHAGFEPAALAISGTTREEHLRYPCAEETMIAFREWLTANCATRPVFISDNPAFDWQFVNYYFHLLCGGNPFGFSARRIGDLFAGMSRNVSASWKHLRKTRHSHHPVDDARGNAEALLAMVDLGLAIPGLSS